MKVKFKVVEGPGAGREFRIPLPKCLVGRSQDCHLRLKSEAISRHHCLVHVREGRVLVHDLRSRSGTYVNGRQVQMDCELKSGDELRLGPLVVQIQIDQERTVPPAATVIGASAPTVAHRSEPSIPLEDSTIAEWIDQADAIAQARRVGDPGTRRLELKPTNRPEVTGSEGQSEASPETSGAQRQTAASSAVEYRVATLRDHNRTPGKLPTPAETGSKDSSDAAAKMLRRYFHGR